MAFLEPNGAGKSTTIDMILGLSPGTVRFYLSSIITKVDASSRLEAIKSARQNGWL